MMCEKNAVSGDGDAAASDHLAHLPERRVLSHHKGFKISGTVNWNGHQQAAARLGIIEQHLHVLANFTLQHDMLLKVGAVIVRATGKDKLRRVGFRALQQGKAVKLDL